MGGHAFQSLLGASALFPRMPLSTYTRLKSHVSSRLAPRFPSMSIAQEDPGKEDFGDLDVVIVANNIVNVTNDTRAGTILELGFITRETMKDDLLALLQADHAISHGTEIISFAISSEVLDKSLEDKQDENGEPANREIEKVYHQVDVNVVGTEEEKESVIFYNSYGDLGLILALLTKTIGLNYSRLGLRLAHETYREPIENQPFFLTKSTKEILLFLTLDFPTWERGFPTRQAIFDWVVSSRFANRHSLLAISPKHLERPMYQDFLCYLSSSIASLNANGPSDSPDTSSSSGPFDPITVVDSALQYFDKKTTYEALAHSIAQRKPLKQVLRGGVVMAITGLEGSVISKIIKMVKDSRSVEELLALSKEEMRQAIVDAAAVATKDWDLDGKLEGVVVPETV